MKMKGAQYPCRCSSSGSCTCKPGISTGLGRLNGWGSTGNKKNGQHLHDRLVVAAEFWNEENNLERHWCSRWGSARVLQFIGAITGKIPERSAAHGKQLLKMALNCLLERKDGNGAHEDLSSLIPLAIHRKKIIRVLMQTDPPTFDFVNQDTPRDSTFFLNRIHKQSSNNCDHAESNLQYYTTYGFEEDGVELKTTQSIENHDLEAFLYQMAPNVLMETSGQTMLFPNQPSKLRVRLSTADFLLQQLSDPSKLPEKLDRMSHLRPGVQVTAILRFENEEIHVNPSKYTFKWVREEHSVAFDVDWMRPLQDASSIYSAPKGYIELWVGPVMIGKTNVECVFGDEEDRDKGGNPPVCQTTWTKLTQLYQSVLMAYSPGDSTIKYALGRAEAELKGCVTILHMHQQGSELNLFLAGEKPHERAIQLCLSQGTVKCPLFLDSAEKLIRAFRRPGVAETPEIVALFWSHPKPDLSSHPTLSQLEGKITHKVFLNDWLVNLPVALSESGFRNQDISESLQNLQPGLQVAFRTSGKKWERGRVVSANVSQPAYFNLVVDSSGELVKDVHFENIKLLGAGEGSPSTDSIADNSTPSTERRISFDSQNVRQTLLGLQEGDFCFARTTKRKQYLPGVIVNIHRGSGTVDVAFENGEAQAHLDIKYVRRTSSSSQVSRPSQPPSRRGRPKTAQSASEVAGRTANTGQFSHGALVQVVTSKDGQRSIGRVKQPLDYGLKYDIMLCNGDVLEGVPVHMISSVEAGNGAEVSTSNKPGRSYVDAMGDRMRTVLSRAAQTDTKGRSSLRIQFEGMDSDGDGLLSVADLTGWLEQLGFSPTEREVFELIDRVAGNSKRTLDYGDFIRFALPMGALQKERHLRKSVSYYEAALSSIGILAEIFSLVGNNVGRVWQTFAENDNGSVGMVKEGEFVQSLLHLGIGLSGEQRQLLLNCFANKEGMVDYREFASVVEVLVAKRIQNIPLKDLKVTFGKGEQGELNARFGRKDIVKGGNSTPDRSSSAKSSRLWLEMEAVTKIQSIFRTRLAMKRANCLRSTGDRKKREGEAMQQLDQSKQSSWWMLHGPDQNPGSLMEDFEDVLDRKSELIEQWRQLLRLNTHNGLEIGPVFRSMDTDCDGAISLQELGNALARHGISKKYCTLLFREMDHDQDGTIDLVDFKLFIRQVAKNTDIATSKARKVFGVQGMVEELGKELCQKLRRFYSVLARCGSNLLELLLFRPKFATITSILRKQGFVLTTSEWKRLEVFFGSTVEHRGDRTVCEEFVEMLAMSEKQLEKHETATEEKHVRDYLQKAKGTSADLAAPLAKLCYKLVQGIQTLCKDKDRKKDKHRILWWLLSLNETSCRLTLDRVEIERILDELRIRVLNLELQKLFEALDSNQTGRISAVEFSKMLGINHRIQEYLESDYSLSRFCKNFVMTQRLKLDQPQSNMSDAHKLARVQGREEFARWISENIGQETFRRLRANIIAAQSRGDFPLDGAWISEKVLAKIGYVEAAGFERFVYESSLLSKSSETSNLSRILTTDGQVDLFLCADLFWIVSTTSPGAISKERRPEKDQEEVRTEEYLRGVLHKFIRTPQGHRNLLRVFQSFDTQRNGTIDKSELELVFQHLGVDLDRVDIMTLLRNHDGNGDEQLDYMEFLQALGVRSYSSKQSADVPKLDISKGAIGPEDDVVLSSGRGVLSAKIASQLHRLKLTKEDIEDACAKTSSSGLLSRGELILVFSDLGIKVNLNDKEAQHLVRLTSGQLKSLMLDLLRQKESIASEKLTPRRSSASSSTTTLTGRIAIGTSVYVSKSSGEVEMGRIIKHSGSGRYDVRLSSGQLQQGVSRQQLRVGTGRAAIATNVLVINNFTKELGTVLQVDGTNSNTFDVRVNGKVYRSVPVAKFTVFHGTKDQYKVGSQVECLSEIDGLYYSGKITRVLGDEKFAVALSHGENLSRVGLAHLRPQA